MKKMKLLIYKNENKKDKTILNEIIDNRRKFCIEFKPISAKEMEISRVDKDDIIWIVITYS